MIVRDECAADVQAIRTVTCAAFRTAHEANLIEALRAQAAPIVSLVADDGGSVVGHIMFTPVRLSAHADLAIMGLAPMAVLPEMQNLGVGSELVRAGLDRCRKLGFAAVVVLGHPGYYPRFGFVPASRFGLTYEYAVPDDVFLAMELVPGALNEKPGTIRYHPAFATT
jgi:putative acetyltransferase